MRKKAVRALRTYKYVPTILHDASMSDSDFVRRTNTGIARCQLTRTELCCVGDISLRRISATRVSAYSLNLARSMAT